MRATQTWMTTPRNWRGGAALVVAAILLGGCGGDRDKANAAPSAGVVKVTRENLASTLEIASEFQPFQEIEVFAKVSGYIRKLEVDWGSHVKQGQVLAVLEVPELGQQIQQDEAAVRVSEHDLERAKEERDRAQSTYNVAHISYTRLADVQKSRPELVAQEEIDEAQGKDLEANAGVSAAKDAESAAQESILSAKANLEKDKALFDYTRITAPFEGVVTSIDAYTGALLPAGTSSNKGDQALCHLSQNDLLRLVIPLPERAVPDVRMNQTVSVKVSALNQTFSGKIVRLSDLIDTQTRTMHVEVHVPNPKGELVPGMYASVELPLVHAQNVLTLPVQAVHINGDAPGTASGGPVRGTVMVLGADNVVQPREVVLGQQTATKVEIVSGVNEGDRVIFGEQGEYKAGQQVTPRLIPASEMEQ
ncbi:MAG: efflux RND transporter periplasmic adaptor subunit [Candidatus Acidiferrales bacterium]